jgi:hypothetical protein
MWFDSYMTNTATAKAPTLSTAHLTRMVFTEAGRMLLTPAEDAAYRAELLRRR